MTSQLQERHVLVINDGQGKQAIALEAAAYSIGRDATNAIVLDFDTVSRQHSILLRVPIPGTNRYKYRLVDGNSEGKPSTNGVFVNGQRCSTHELLNGDTIGLGRKVKATYLSLAMAENEFHKYLQSITFQSIKSKQLDPRATLIGAEMQPGELASVTELAARELTTVAVPVQSPLAAARLASKNTIPPDRSEAVSSIYNQRDAAIVETVHEPVVQKAAKPDIARIVSIGIITAAIIATFLCFKSSIFQPRTQPTPVQPTAPQ